ncbi:GNAT family N-acetyltransferase [Nonomuraea sp. NPDC049695]|uniref:GNAT family N-acetyltransferase n=1 Tax=Nonomuraea sp. NPDC049695 TaxID=3154734 RepID=UPI00342DD8D8
MTDRCGGTRDVDLLRAELGVIWRLDERGRLPGPESLVIGVAADGMTAAVAGGVPGETAARLLSLISGPGAPPDVLDDCRELLGGEAVSISGGPTYLVDPPVRAGVAAEVLRSDSADHVRLAWSLARPDDWGADEWDDLVAGDEGAPWAMIADGGQVVALCHTSRLTPSGAEAGTWTSPAYRGRGFAAATTAAWSELLPGLLLFYSTSAGNHSSQRVAQRLGLRPLGWLWKLTSPPAGSPDQVM